MTPLHTPVSIGNVDSLHRRFALHCDSSCHVFFHRHPTAFLLYANGRPTTDLDKLGSLVQREADKLVNDGPTAKELNRVKKVTAVVLRCKRRCVSDDIRRLRATSATDHAAESRYIARTVAGSQPERTGMHVETIVAAFRA